MVQVMAWCLTAPNHYLNQCWLLISDGQWHSPEISLALTASALSIGNYIPQKIMDIVTNPCPIHTSTILLLNPTSNRLYSPNLPHSNRICTVSLHSDPPTLPKFRGTCSENLASERLCRNPDFFSKLFLYIMVMFLKLSEKVCMLRWHFFWPTLSSWLRRSERWRHQALIDHSVIDTSFFIKMNPWNTHCIACLELRNLGDLVGKQILLMQQCMNSTLTNWGRVTHMRQWIMSTLVQIMACRLIGAKPLYEPMLPCYQ